jgi:cytochrome P450
VTFDHYSVDLARDPYPTLAAMRKECPVAHSDAHGGFWIATRYADVQDLCARPADFSSRYTSVPTDIGLGDVQMPPVQLDPPDHTRFKKLLTPAFAAGEIGRFEALARAYVADLLDGLVGKGAFDASHDFARLVPTAILCQVIGDPTSVEPLSALVETILENAGTNPDVAIASGMELFGYMGGIVAERTETPGDDVISLLLRSEVDGERLADTEVTVAGIVLVLAGIDTTWSTLALAIHHLATHPADQARLREQPGLLESAREEFLRAYAPVTTARLVTRDTTLAGQPLTKDEMILVSFRDETVFERADEVLLDRANNRHMAFGSGIHRCLGVHLARMELRVALEELLTRVPPFRLDETREVVWAAGQVRRPKAVPIRFQ